MLQIAELGPAGIDRQVAPPEESADPYGIETGLEHCPIYPATREIHEDVGEVAHGEQRANLRTAAADVRQNEAHPGMPHGQSPQHDGSRRFLTGYIASAVLPDVM